MFWVSLRRVIRRQTVLTLIKVHTLGPGSSYVLQLQVDDTALEICDLFAQLAAQKLTRTGPFQVFSIYSFVYSLLSRSVARRI